MGIDMNINENENWGNSYMNELDIGKWMLGF